MSSSRRVPARRVPAQSVLMWFGLFGAPAAWMIQFVVGLSFTFAACLPAGQSRDLPVDAFAIALSTAGVATGLAAWISAWTVQRATRNGPEAPPASRVHFLAVIGTVVSPLFVCIMVMSGLGVVFLDNCHQG